MRVWPVLLILSACGTNVITSPTDPTSDDQVVTEPDAAPAETAVEAAAARPDVGRDSWADAPREASPDVAAPDVAQDSTDASVDAPEAWVWHPYDSGRKPDVADVADVQPAGVPIQAVIGQDGWAWCLESESTNAEVVSVPATMLAAKLRVQFAAWGCCESSKYYAPVTVCVVGVSSARLDSIEGNTINDVPGGCGMDEDTPVVSTIEHELNTFALRKDPAGTTYSVRMGVTCGHAKVTGVIEVR